MTTPNEAAAREVLYGQLSEALVGKDIGRFQAIAFLNRHEILAALASPRKEEAVGETRHPRYGPCDGFGPGGQCSECTGFIQRRDGPVVANVAIPNPSAYERGRATGSSEMHAAITAVLECYGFGTSTTLGRAVAKIGEESALSDTPAEPDGVAR